MSSISARLDAGIGKVSTGSFPNTDARVERAGTHAERWSDHAPVTVAYDHEV